MHSAMDSPGGPVIYSMTGHHHSASKQNNLLNMDPVLNSKRDGFRPKNNLRGISIQDAWDP